MSQTPTEDDRSASDGTNVLPLPVDPTTTSAAALNNRVFISHGKNRKVVDQLKTVIGYGNFEPVVSIDNETVSKPLSDKVLDDMRSCSFALLCRRRKRTSGPSRTKTRLTKSKRSNRNRGRPRPPQEPLCSTCKRRPPVTVKPTRTLSVSICRRHFANLNATMRILESIQRLPRQAITVAQASGEEIWTKTVLKYAVDRWRASLN